MRFSIHILCWILIVPLVAIGCATPRKVPARHVDYYTLEYPPAPARKDSAALAVVLGVQDFQIAPAYNTTRIVYRDKAYTRNTYQYHKWRANPAELVAYFLSRDLDRSGVFKAVFTADQRQPVTHVLEGTVDEFFEYDGDKAWQAVLTVAVTLLKAGEPDNSRRVVLHRRYQVREPCEKKNPQALSAAMSRAMAELSRSLIDDIATTLNRDQESVVSNQ